MTEPTVEEMMIEVLKWMGWKIKLPDYDSGDTICVVTTPEGVTTSIYALDKIPPLTHDFLHECEGKLTGSNIRDYEINLIQLLGLPLESTPYEGPTFPLIHATKEQKLTALCAVIHAA